MPQKYHSQNIFAKILRGEVPNDTIFDSDHSLAFRDIMPQAPDHVLVIPKGAYIDFSHFASEATSEEIVDFTQAIGEVCKLLGVSAKTGGAGYRVISNSGRNGVQEVPHLHVHILAGRLLGRMVNPA